MNRVRALASRVAQHRLFLAALFAVGVWLWLVGRFWHPVYGFTRFLQLDASAESCAIPELRAEPVFVYRDTGGYDGLYYAQLAFHPGLNSPALPDAIDNLRYRARRILGSAIAWVLAGGDPHRIARIYAGLNLVVWLALARLLWAVLPVRDARSWCAWAGVLFSAGAMFSVRLALTDLLALTGLVAAWWMVERGRLRGSLAALATAALARETTLGALFMWCDRVPRTLREAARFAVIAALVTLPLAAWIAYTYAAAPIGDQGTNNLTWPLVGWVAKCRELVRVWPGDAGAWLTSTTILAFTGVSAQALWFLRRPQPADRIWRLGAAYVALFLVLAYGVWEGNPGAATRVLLPLSFAFALAAARTAMPWAWLLAGTLPVFAGLEAMRLVPHDPTEVFAGTTGEVAYVSRATAGCFAVERNSRHAWAWSSGQARLELKTWPAVTGSRQVSFELRSLGPRTVVVTQGDRECWRGACGPKWTPAAFAVEAGPSGALEFSIHALEPGVPESAAAGARTLGFALRRVELAPLR